MTGTRLPDGFEPTREQLAALGYDHTPRGAYWIDSNGEWSACTPNGRIGSLANHTVTEHEDHTITVHPSILVHPVEPVAYTAEQIQRMIEAGFPGETTWPGRPGWHGFLERGIWREC